MRIFWLIWCGFFFVLNFADVCGDAAGHNYGWLFVNGIGVVVLFICFNYWLHQPRRVRR